VIESTGDSYEKSLASAGGSSGFTGFVVWALGRPVKDGMGFSEFRLSCPCPWSLDGLWISWRFDPPGTRGSSPSTLDVWGATLQRCRVDHALYLITPTGKFNVYNTVEDIY
jgi:hypothetical protein